MSCDNSALECDTIQIIEPSGDLLVDTAGTTSDVDERGELTLTEGQVSAGITFLAPKLNGSYTFEYLYVESIDHVQPGGVHVIPVSKTRDGFNVVFAGSPIGPGYVLFWRVVIARTTSMAEIDAPENLYLQMPQTNTMQVVFTNQRSSVAYGFTELRVENLTDSHQGQAVIHVQVYNRTVNGFSLAVNPVPPTTNYFLKVRTP